MLFIFFMICLLPTVVAHAAVSGDWTYTDNGDGTATITAYSNSTAKEVLIPEELGGLSVEVIGESAFAKNSVVQEITIPALVISIGEYAFSGCENLSGVNNASGVVSIGEGAFSETELSTFPFGSALTVIGEKAFYRCSFTTVTIPENLTELGTNAFFANSIVSYSVNASNTEFVAIDGVLFSNGGTTLKSYPIYKTGTSYTGTCWRN